MPSSLPTWLQSSTDPTGQTLSNTVTGAIVSVSSFIVIFAPVVLHLSVTTTQVTNFAGDMGAGAGAIWFVYGLSMKLIMFVSKNRTS